MWGKNSGYKGWSMSVRAASAYSDGEKPLSKWSKSDILSGYSENMAQQLKRFNLATLKHNCLEYTCWHHTSKFCNKTDFYRLKEEDELDINEFVLQ